MAISYPLSLPTNIGMASIELRAKNTVAVSSSPFTYKQTVYAYDGPDVGSGCYPATNEQG